MEKRNIYKILSLSILLLLSLQSSVINVTTVQNNFFQATWLVEIKKTSTYPVSYKFGLKNFQYRREIDIFHSSDAASSTGEFRSLLRRESDSTFISLESSLYQNAITTEEIKKYLSANLEDQSGRFGVIEDISYNSDPNYSKLTFCEVLFYYTPFRNYRTARLDFESKKALGKKVALVGPKGIVDSPFLEYFIEKYTTYWCPYPFGVINLDILKESLANRDDRAYYYYGTPEASPTEDYTLPILANDNSSVTDECHFFESETVDSVNFIPFYFPSHFNTHCFYKEVARGNGQSGTVNFTYCANSVQNFNSNIAPVYLGLLGKCKSGDRTFLKLRDLSTYPDITITVTANCDSKGDTDFTVNFSDFNNGFYNYSEPIYTNESAADSNNCSYTNSTELAACPNTINVVCNISSIDPPFFNASISTTSSILVPGVDDGNPGTQTYKFSANLSIDYLKTYTP